jgi:hypothetical protein
MPLTFDPRPWLRRGAAVALLCAAGVAGATPAESPADDDDATGALIGELMFRADLLLALDTLCPRGGSSPDWHAALPPLPADATTPELLELSRALGTDAGQELVHESGGCRSPDFAAAYVESRQTFIELIERWRTP